MEEGKGKKSIDDSSSVKVAVRVRPLIGQEKINKEPICIRVDERNKQIWMGSDRAFTFDCVFDMESAQESLYTDWAEDLVTAAFSGYNATVLAYGQTGSGKTFTMGSGQRLSIPENEIGIIPRVIQKVFSEIEERKEKAEFILKVSFLEIYNEEIHDLLQPKHTSITIREDKGSICLMGLHEERVESYEQMASCLDKGTFHRSTASTLMNVTSSRSHAIFTINIEQHIIDDLVTGEKPKEDQETQEYMTAKFHFVDLAGSERAKRTGATGSVLKEGININKGLLCLGNVISALTEVGKKALHVPYRDSKLTRILQDSLGGNSKTCMIACVSPAEINFEETLNALKYANRARNIQNKPMVNRDPNSVMLAQLRQEVFELKAEIRNYQQILNVSGNPEMQEQLASMRINNMMCDDDTKNLKVKFSQLEKKANENAADLDVTRNRLNTVEIEAMMAKRERDMFKSKLEDCVELLKQHGIEFDEGEAGSERLIEEYGEQIERLTKENQEKEKVNRELQLEYETLMRSSERDSILLGKLSQEIETCRREMTRKVPLSPYKIDNTMIESVDSYGKLFVESIKANLDMETPVTEVTEEDETLETEESVGIPEPDLEAEKSELNLVTNSIREKEELLHSIEETFKDMQGQLLSKMTEQYHHKIASLEGDIKAMEHDRDTAVQKASHGSDRSKISEAYKKKISQLEVQLQQQKKNDREQSKLFKLVETQKTKIGRLADEIKNAKVQKVQLTKKIKQEQDNFTRMRAERNRELIKMRRQNLIKDQKIIKLENEKRKKDIIVRRKIEELNAYQKRAKDRPSKAILDPKTVKKFISEYTDACIAEEQMKVKLRREMDEKNKIVESIENLQKGHARATLRRERNLLQLNEEEDYELLASIEQDEAEIKEMNETIEALEDKRQYKENLIIQAQSRIINSDVQNMKAKYLNINSVQDSQLVATVLFDELMSSAEIHKALAQQLQEKDIALEEAQADAQKQRRKLLSAKVEMANMEAQFEEKRQMLQTGSNPIIPVEEIDEGLQTANQLEQYEKALHRVNKTKVVAKSTSNLSRHKPKTTYSQVNVTAPAKSSTAISSLAAARNRKKQEKIAAPPMAQPEFKENWKQAHSLKAHNDKITSLVSNENVLFSASHKTFKLWNLDAMSVISEVPAHNGFINAMEIMAESSIVLTACEKEIKIWDTISLQNLGNLNGHRDQIEAICVFGGYVFSSGQGQAGPSLLVWDLRLQNTPIAELERGMDIYSILGMNDTLYYTGTNQSIGRLSLPSMEILPAFDMSHGDTVKSIVGIPNSILSGSLDRTIKRWDLDSDGLGRDIGEHDQAIYSLETDSESTHLYSAGNDGKINIWAINDVLESMAELNGHNETVNSLARISCDTRAFVSGGSDHFIRIWKQSE